MFRRILAIAGTLLVLLGGILMAYNADLLRAIKTWSAKSGVPADVLVATTLVESGGNPYGPGGDNGRSWGAWQEYDMGRGHGLTRAQRQDPYASTARAAREFGQYFKRGLRGGALAAAAQRPANPGAYSGRVDSLLGQARSILGGSGVGGFGAPSAAPISVDTPATDQLAGGFDGKQLLSASLLGRREGESLTSSVRRSMFSGLRLNGGGQLGSRPFIDGPPTGEQSTAGNAAADIAVVRNAKRWLGTMYSWGGGSDEGPTTGIGRGAGTKGFDCSSLVKYAWAKVGVHIPRTTYDQIRTGKAVRLLSQVRPGDLLFPSKGHVQMYIGNGQVIESPRTGLAVRTAPLRDRYIAIRRPGG